MGGKDTDAQGFLLPNETTQKILKAARHQLQGEEGDDYDNDEARDETGGDVEDELEADDKLNDDYYHEGYNKDEAPLVAGGGEDEDDDDGTVNLDYDDSESVATELENFQDLGDEYNIDDEEARLLEKFQPKTGMQTRNLADIIMGKIREQEVARKNADGSSNAGGPPSIDKRVARVYIAIGHVLKRYTSGKIPKAFKVLPHIQNWEELLMLTNPHEWSPHATYAATRIFAANLNEKLAQRYYSTILLPIIMEHLVSEKKLHPALYMAIRKSLFKPVAFFKGFLLPLIEDDDCSLKMALVVASVLQKMHLPPVPTAVVIYSISRLPFRGPNCVFLRVLIDKKMTLPLQVIDALVAHFHRFIKTHNKDDLLPVLWHQTLLSFVQRYKDSLTLEQILLLRDVCDVHFHRLITPETRREMNIALQKLNGGSR
eukprot:GILI01013400.1.p1 GENE.GILI01013400.1~~GILI01013400.1.p1  ORF type:complete len:429 (+),score=142.90 GILI01013400.1:18-1304(+)